MAEKIANNIFQLYLKFHEKVILQKTSLITNQYESSNADSYYSN